MATKKMSIKISEDMHEWIAFEAEKRGLTMNAVIIFALETYQQQSTILPNIAMMKEMMDKLENE
ncbi:hypothetical protein [Bacillus sp. FJAT-22090]|uniref:hypothetical protein n=1 Tax=Bacillus sp. FJAT-22090 TaxID=1581038 RepID=UPI0011A0371B|nr:hypothetical protein [Bacillus sp. FJAT-22090]